MALKLLTTTLLAGCRLVITRLLFTCCDLCMCVQCRGGQGVCPDTLITEQTGTQDVTMIAGDVTNDQRCVEYQRPLNSSTQLQLLLMYCVRVLGTIVLITGDPLDRNYLINRQSQFVVWAIGPRATEEGLMNLAFFHTEYPRNGGELLYQLCVHSVWCVHVRTRVCV